MAGGQILCFNRGMQKVFPEIPYFKPVRQYS